MVSWRNGIDTRRKLAPGFTLIELLIAVLIIAILALIALPNMLEFQTRSKVSRALSDMRVLTTGLEAYCVEHDDYPPSDIIFFNPTAQAQTWRVTTPIAYITSVPIDYFVKKPGNSAMGGPFGIGGIYLHYLHDESMADTYWLLFSYGPDLDLEYQTIHYDPSNGTRSNGDIYRTAFGK